MIPDLATDSSFFFFSVFVSERASLQAGDRVEGDRERERERESE